MDTQLVLQAKYEFLHNNFRWFRHWAGASMSSYVEQRLNNNSESMETLVRRMTSAYLLWCNVTNRTPDDDAVIEDIDTDSDSDA